MTERVLDNNKHNHEVHTHKVHNHEECGCGHDHAGHGHGHNHDDHEVQEHVNKETKQVFGHATKQVYILENLGCANCAAKMERQISELPQVDYANITFATKQLQVVLNSKEELLPVFQKICASIESEVTVTKREKREVKSKVKAGRLSESKQDFIEIGLGAALLIGAKLTDAVNANLSLILYVVGYLILGRQVLLTAIKNLAKGRVFDENFLMSIATLGAFVIGDYAEALGIMIFYRVGELFEQIAVAKSRSQIMDAVDMRPEVVNRMQGNQVVEIPAEDASVGDIVQVRPGDRIPLDGTIIEGESRIDTSPVTGEPVPVAAKAGDAVTSGCVNTSGLLKIRVDKVLEDSMVTRILDSV